MGGGRRHESGMRQEAMGLQLASQGRFIQGRRGGQGQEEAIREGPSPGPAGVGSQLAPLPGRKEQGKGSFQTWRESELESQQDLSQPAIH